MTKKKRLTIKKDNEMNMNVHDTLYNHFQSLPKQQKRVQDLMTMDRGQCGNDRPGFGLPSITPGMAGYNYKRLLEF